MGSKIRLIQKYKLWEFFPEGMGHHKVIHNGVLVRSIYSSYIEPFAGSIVMFFNLDPVPFKCIVNDIDEEIFNFWNVVKENCEDLMKELEYVWNGDSWLKKLDQKGDDVSRAIAFYIRNRRGLFFQGTPDHFYKDFRFWKERMDKSQICILNLDYKKVFEIINKPKGKNRGSGSSELDYIVYEDPPYHGSECIYKTGSFLNEDHEILAKINHRIKHHVFLSYNDCKEIRELYSDWFMIELDNYSKFTEKNRKELFISNRPLVRRSVLNQGIQKKVI